MKKKTVRAQLDEALAAFSRDDGEAALGVLLQAWREWPSRRLADLLDAVSKQTPSPPLSATAVKALEAEWLERAAHHRPIDVRALLEAPWPVHPREAKARFKAWAKMPADPRVLRFGRQLLEAGRYKSNAGILLHRWWCEAAVKAKDPEAEAFIAAQADLFRYFGVHQLLMQRKLPKEPAATPELDDALKALESKLGLSTKLEAKPAVGREQLFSAVYANPADDGARLVLADWLLEQGDPRGEFIQLQVRDARGEATEKHRKRATALGRAAGATWLDGLEEDVLWDTWNKARFARGFAVEVTLKPRKPRAAKHPGWATVEVVRLMMKEPEALFGAADLKSLREVHGIGVAGLQRLASRSTPLEKVTLLAAELETLTASPLIDSLCTSNRLPLERVVAWGKKAPFWAGLKRLELDGDESQLGELHQLTPQLPPKLSAIGIHRAFLNQAGWALTLSRDAQGMFTRLHAEFTGRAGHANQTPGFAAALEKLPKDALTEIELAQKKPVPEDELAQVAAALRRQTRLRQRA